MADKRAAISNSELENRISRREHFVHGGAIVVIVGVLLEYIPRLRSFFCAPTWTEGLPLLGGALIAIGIAVEVRTGILISGDESTLRDRYKVEIARLYAQAQEDRLARAKIEERLKARWLTEEARAKLRDSLIPFASRRVDVFVFDHEDEEVSLLADSINGTLISAGLNSIMFHASGPRMSGRDVTFAIARDSTKAEQEDLNGLAWKIGGFLQGEGIVASHLWGGFSTTEGPSIVGGWPRGWDREDVARLRIQIRKKDLVPSPFST